MKKNFPLLALIISASLLLGGCGANGESAIATAVALTVQAQNASASATPFPSATAPAANVQPTLTNIFTPAPPTGTALSGSYAECARASLINETIPDGTIMQPETSFFKTWTIKNESACTWNTNYKIVFWDGNTFGGAYVYNLPLVTGPGQNTDISIQLYAPKENGTHKGEWKLQTPDGITFGVGQYGEAFYAEVVVNAAAEKEDYKIISVEYRLVRDPLAGCATNVIFTVYATITTNGPFDSRVQWRHNDGWTSSKIRLTFTSAGSQELVDRWGIHLGSSPGDKWIQLTQVDPGFVEFDKVPFSYLCQ
ncbi:MAG: hypothetical protein HFACDABA_01475 [Anaerolineales bacterium]|nr:hypothetical protein [Anaerolineales bacterium]